MILSFSYRYSSPLYGGERITEKVIALRARKGGERRLSAAIGSNDDRSGNWLRATGICSEVGGVICSRAVVYNNFLGIYFKIFFGHFVPPYGGSEMTKNARCAHGIGTANIVFFDATVIAVDSTVITGDSNFLQKPSNDDDNGNDNCACTWKTTMATTSRHWNSTYMFFRFMLQRYKLPKIVHFKFEIC